MKLDDTRFSAVGGDSTAVTYIIVQAMLKKLTGDRFSKVLSSM